jgi:hypothetical protein
MVVPYSIWQPVWVCHVVITLYDTPLAVKCRRNKMRTKQGKETRASQPAVVFPPFEARHPSAGQAWFLQNELPGCVPSVHVPPDGEGRAHLVLLPLVLVLLVRAVRLRGTSVST